MRWCFWIQMNDLGRMEARVIQVLDRLQASALIFSSAKLDDQIFISCVIEAAEPQTTRIEALLRKVHGMSSVIVTAESNATQRMIALFRVCCDISDRAEVLQFVHAVNARAIMIRPLWVAFEVVGTPQEVEGIYQSVVGYGIVDIVSASCALTPSKEETGKISRAISDDSVEAALV